jgi:hypothetical protein
MRWWVLVVGAVAVGCGDEPRDSDDDDGGGSGAAGPVGPGAGAGTSSDAYSQCVDTINAYRESVGVAPLARWSSAEACSDGEAASDAASGQPHGAFGECGEFAQNECPGWPGPPEQMIGGCLSLMWDEGPGGGHYDNMSSTSYSEVACGFHVLGGGDVWAVQNFR